MSKNLLVSAIAAMLFGCGSNPDSEPLPVKNKSTVIVIGAGISGLAAAKSLQDSGFTVTVLEARNRLGGRMWSKVDENGSVFDMGASWIHEIDGNPITEIATENNISMLNTDYQSMQIYDEQGGGGSLSQAQEATFMQALFTGVRQKISETANEPVQTVIEDIKDNDHGLSHTEINFLTNFAIDLEFAASPQQLSVTGLTEGEGYSGEDAVLPAGYNQINQVLAVDLDIRLSNIVAQVDYRDQTVSVTTTKGDIYTADKVIITVPLGVLKKKSIAFYPDLPANKATAIDALGMGLLNKLFLTFPYAFWDANIAVNGYISKVRGEWNLWYNFEPVTNKPTLLALTGGTTAVSLEALSDKETVASAMATLKTIYGSDIPEPQSYHISRWNQDEFSYGAYSYLTTAADNSMRASLAESVDNKVFFAGEATSQNNPSTVHGAYLSGLREAEKIKALNGN